MRVFAFLILINISNTSYGSIYFIQSKFGILQVVIEDDKEFNDVYLLSNNQLHFYGSVALQLQLNNEDVDVAPAQVLATFLYEHPDDYNDHMFLFGSDSEIENQSTDQGEKYPLVLTEEFNNGDIVGLDFHGVQTGQACGGWTSSSSLCNQVSCKFGCSAIVSSAGLAYHHNSHHPKEYSALKSLLKSGIMCPFCKMGFYYLRNVKSLTNHFTRSHPDKNYQDFIDSFNLK